MNSFDTTSKTKEAQIERKEASKLERIFLEREKAPKRGKIV